LAGAATAQVVREQDARATIRPAMFVAHQPR
jgi:hypothetical protein